VINSRRRRRGLVECMKEIINVNKIMVGTPEEKRPHPRLSSKWEGKSVRMWTGLIWLRLESSGWLL
jgi:hypothetical protein